MIGSKERREIRATLEEITVQEKALDGVIESQNESIKKAVASRVELFVEEQKRLQLLANEEKKLKTQSSNGLTGGRIALLAHWLA